MRMRILIPQRVDTCEANLVDKSWLANRPNFMGLCSPVIQFVGF